MTLTIFAIIFTFSAIAIGRDGTAKALIGILGNIIVIIALIFSIWMGINEWLAIIISCVLMTAISLFYQSENKQKNRIAAMSVLLMMVLLAGFSYLIIYLANLQGFPTGQVSIRPANGYKAEVGVNFFALQMGVVLIMLEGAMVDTAISVVSSMEEVTKHAELSARDLFDSGMAVGRGILSSTINTLFFIFLGQNLVFFIFFRNEFTVESMLNSKILAQELTSVLISAIGCVLIIPVAAFLSSRYMNTK